MPEQGRHTGQQFGNYRLERLLGRGGFAEVYLGVHIHLKRQAALKILHAHLSQSEITDFQREAEIIAALDHPHIIRILDFDVWKNIPFLVMDYLPNGTLKQRYRRGEHMPLSTVLHYVQQIADALQYAHEKRLIHRDVKPGNMLLGNDDKIVLSDFGIATVAYNTSSMPIQATVGTISYMAPEQIYGQARPASDQYSLAAVVYEWLTGDRLFQGTYTEIYARQLTIMPPSLCEKVPNLPVAVEEVVFKALAKDPRQRFETVSDFSSALQLAGQVFSNDNKKTLVIKRGMQDNKENRKPVLKNSDANDLLPDQVTLVQSATVREKLVSSKLTRRSIIAGLAGSGVLVAGVTGLGVWWFQRSRSTLLPGDNATVYIYHGHHDSVNSLCWSPDGKRIASASSDRTIQIWNALNGSNLFTYHGHSESIKQVLWSPDGEYLASVDWGRTIRVWNAHSGRTAYTYQAANVTNIAWSSDSQHLALVENNRLQIFDALTGLNRSTYDFYINDTKILAWSPDGKLLVVDIDFTNNKNLTTYRVQDQQHIAMYYSDRTILTIAWSPDSKYIAWANDNREINIWDTSTGKNTPANQQHQQLVTALSWSPDTEKVASASLDKTVQVWSFLDETTTYTYHGHTDGVSSVAWSPKGAYVASAGADQTVQIWKAP